MKLGDIRKRAGCVIGGVLLGHRVSELEIIQHLIAGNKLEGLELVVSSDGYTKVVEVGNHRDKLLRYLGGSNDNKSEEELDDLVDNSIPESSEYKNITDKKERVESFIDFINANNIERLNIVREE